MYPVAETLFDDYANRGTAAKEAEMRIHDHMALTADNKIAPEILEKLNYEEFLGWYTGAYTERFNRLKVEEQEQWMKVYGPINEDFEENQPVGQALTLWKYQRYLEDYLGTIVSVDRNIGRVLDYLDENGLSENTLVIYTSDQGFYLGEHGWFDKRFMYEESFRTPLLIRYPPMIEAGSANADLVQNIDFAPTLLELAGLEVPEDMQGLSLLPILNEEETEWRDELYYHYYEYPGIHAVKRHYGIRTEPYKLIRFYYDVEEWELYDLEVDPGELNNVYESDDYAEIREELHQRLADLRIQYQDSDELDQQFIEYDLQRLRDRGWLE
jgi:arylsulfatase A-like enzyme